jgi:uncharacterized membrane protein YphA (DoxX/SURF4 family)
MVDIDILARVLTAGILLWAAVAKLTSRDPGRLEPYGIPAALRAPGYYLLAAVEAAVAAALLLGAFFAPFAAVALGVVFVAALSYARARGIRRLDCGCFGSKERSVEALLLRALGFTALAGLGTLAVEVSTPPRDTLVVIALAALGVAVVVLGALVLALYRQVGVLTLRVGPGVALELAEEGPVLGAGRLLQPWVPALSSAGSCRAGAQPRRPSGSRCVRERGTRGVRALGHSRDAVRGSRRGRDRRGQGHSQHAGAARAAACGRG